MKNAVREYFPGSNTPEGFFSYYDYILNSREANRIIVLKGGPGTGKSTFMKRVATHFLSLGYDIELLHCSSDPDSLDGVCVRDAGFLILDGTAPHVVDPKAPGAVDEIINLGNCWDKEKMLRCKNTIIDTNEKISEKFARAYRYLEAAKSLQEQISRDLSLLTDDLGIKAEMLDAAKRIVPDGGNGKEGHERKAFLSAITPLGRVNYIDTFVKNAECVYSIEAEFVPDSGKFMTGIAQLLLQNGVDIHTFYCPMSPDKKLEHIYVPQSGLFITTQNTYHRAKSAENEYVTDLNKYVKMRDVTLDTVSDMEFYNLLINRASDTIAEAKELHDELEKNYIPNMDFDMVETLYTNLIESIN